MTRRNDSTEQRKDEHITICLDQQVEGVGITTGLEQWRFKHLSLPEINFSTIDISTTMFGKQMKTPLLISSMTGGTKQAAYINQQLAIAAEERGWALALGSMKVALENEQAADSFQLRSYAPSIPIISNIGLVSLNYGVDVDSCQRVVDISEADALVFHLNSLQEVFQPEGDTNFAGLLRKLERIVKQLSIPIGVKDVGWGIDADVRDALLQVGIQFIDVAGAGGTSWSQVEHFRSKPTIQHYAAPAFLDWGNPTSDCIIELRDGMDGALLVGSGGLKHGVDAAKVIALGADIAGFGRTLLSHVADTKTIAQSIEERLATIEYELKTAMFGIGVSTIQQLKRHPRLISATR